jgi:hypothetical protein
MFHLHQSELTDGCSLLQSVVANGGALEQTKHPPPTEALEADERVRPQHEP